MLRLESSGDKFSATYRGSVEDYILNPMSPGLPISVTFQSDREATIMPICDSCSVVITKIKKVFWLYCKDLDLDFAIAGNC